MEESKSWSEWTGKCSEETAESLRNLRVQADESLNTRRRHLSDLETELNHRIQQVASELAHELVETRAHDESNSHEKLLAQIDQLTHQVEQEAHQQDQLNQELTGIKQALTELNLELTELNQEKAQFQEGLQTQTDQLQQQQQQLSEQETEQVRLQEALQEARAELDSLRAERDALAARVGELEDAPAVAMDANQQEEIADLQQRFEMAIDDVRQLKQEKSQLQAELQTQLEALQTCEVAPADEGPLDWQAQKAMMLASLSEEEGEPISQQRLQDRTTIEDTLSLTDQIVAEKDHAIVELREQLTMLQADLNEANQSSEESQPSEQASRDALLTDDEIIQRERARLEQLQQEWEDKLRQAELDISIERATLAREQAALEEKLATVKELPPEDQIANDQRPRRRWMAALGIKSDDEGK